MTSIEARQLDGDRFEVTVRDHALTTDQPVPTGDDEGPTPVELFVASLTACVAVLARRYLARHGVPTSGLTVTAEHEVTDRPSRVAAVRLAIHLPAGVPESRGRSLLTVASHCTVHNTLRTPPEVTITLA